MTDFSNAKAEDLVSGANELVAVQIVLKLIIVIDAMMANLRALCRLFLWTNKMLFLLMISFI